MAIFTNKTRLISAVCACLVVLSFKANASYVDYGTYTTVNGLDWLDLTETAGMSYNQVSAELGTGGIFDGWSYATLAQVSAFWDAFGGDSARYTGWSTQNNGLFDTIAPLWGDLICDITRCAPGEGQSSILTADVATTGTHRYAFMYDYYLSSKVATQDFIALQAGNWTDASGDLGYGSALIRPSLIPIPAAVWLFSSGLLGLIGMARRKTAA